MWVAYLFPLVAHSDRELEWMSKGYAIDRPYPLFCVPRLLRPTLEYELLMRDDETRRLFYLFRRLYRPLDPMDPGGDFMRDTRLDRENSLPTLGESALAEPAPLGGVQLPAFPYASSFSSEFRFLP